MKKRAEPKRFEVLVPQEFLAPTSLLSSSRLRVKDTLGTRYLPWTPWLAPNGFNAVVRSTELPGYHGLLGRLASPPPPRMSILPVLVLIGNSAKTWG